MNIVIPMAGRGTRLSHYSSLPKPLITISNKTMLEIALETIQIDGHYIFITRKYLEKEWNQRINFILNDFPCSKKTIIDIDYFTDGAAQTCLAAEHLIHNSTPLIITNCDQAMSWKSNRFLEECKKSQADGALVTFESSNPKHSYAKVSGNNVEKIQEKEVISPFALTGIHYYKHGSYFIDSALQMVNAEDKTKNEYYISMTYNYMLKKNKKVLNYQIDANEFWPLGTPNDIELYLSQKNEFK